MRRIGIAMAAVAMAVTLAFGLSACGGQKSSNASAGSGSAAASAASAAVSAAFKSNSPSKDGFDAAAKSTTQCAGVTFMIPDYFGQPNSKSNGESWNYYAERGGKTSMIGFFQRNLPSSHRAENLEKELRDSMDGVFQGMEKSMKGIEHSDYASTEVAGYPGLASAWRGELNGLECVGKTVIFINDDKKLFGSATFTETTNTDFDYASDFDKIIASGSREAPKAEESASSAPAAGADASGVSPDVKEALDSYEAFMDEYIAFMQKYKSSDDVSSMMMDYATYMTKYADMMKKIDAMDSKNMSAADAAYYAEVTTRVSQKLLNAAV